MMLAPKESGGGLGSRGEYELELVDAGFFSLIGGLTTEDARLKVPRAGALATE